MPVVPPNLGCLTKNPCGDDTQGKKPASLFRVRQKPAYTLCLDNGGSSGAGYLLPFALQLRGPFSAFFRAGSHLFLLSVPG